MTANPYSVPIEICLEEPTITNSTKRASCGSYERNAPSLCMPGGRGGALSRSTVVVPIPLPHSTQRVSDVAHNASPAVARPPGMTSTVVAEL